LGPRKASFVRKAFAKFLAEIGPEGISTSPQQIFKTLFKGIALRNTDGFQTFEVCL
jgi:hypothetical protein